MTACPCCGYDGEGSVSFKHIAAMARLSALETGIFLCLSRNVGRYVTLETIVGDVYAGVRDGGPTSTRQTIGVTVHRMKKKIEPFGLTIQGQGGCGDNGRRLVWKADLDG